MTEPGLDPCLDAPRDTLTIPWTGGPAMRTSTSASLRSSLGRRLMRECVAPVTLRSLRPDCGREDRPDGLMSPDLEDALLKLRRSSTNVPFCATNPSRSLSRLSPLSSIVRTLDIGWGAGRLWNGFHDLLGCASPSCCKCMVSITAAITRCRSSAASFRGSVKSNTRVPVCGTDAKSCRWYVEPLYRMFWNPRSRVVTPQLNKMRSTSWSPRLLRSR
mmetsp:Transcript_7320/g.16769  ORF Transcript_7320/g.16769 Transcript_7320/m.16769 type:complete len:217 (+) Transcript_7320:1036-1686(+)